MPDNLKLDIPDILDIQPTPDQYVLETPLKKAVETALRFNQPLLLTGEPGTGKTQLAYKVASMLHEQTKGKALEMVFAKTEPLRFNTKTTSQARDLFYLYDAIGHFQQANMRNAEDKKTALRPTADFIELQALGQAIVMANPKKEYGQRFKFEMPEAPTSSVVLIDEVDKAPRDFTNDILNEIERREFFVKEQENYQVGLDLGLTGQDGKPQKNTQRLLLIMTSNSEKNLPEAFLRRCVFYHIPTPKDQRLRAILKAHIAVPQDPEAEALLDDYLETLTDAFEELRAKAARKPPATAELVAVIKLLALDETFYTKEADAIAIFRDNISLLIKTKEDKENVEKFLKLDDQA